MQRNSKKKKRRNISNVVGGKAVTEDETVSRMKAYIEESARGKKMMPVNKTPTKPKNKKSSKTLNKSANKTPRISRSKAAKNTSPKKIKSVSSQKSGLRPINSPQPGPSHINLVLSEDGMSTDDESPESQIPERSKCCQCKRVYVSADKIDTLKIPLTNRAQCETCDHWVHYLIVRQLVWSGKKRPPSVLVVTIK